MNTQKPKVLVFDDTEHHRQSAHLLLSKDYDLTVVSTYDDAQRALLKTVDNNGSCEGEAKKRATIYPGYDYVLLDLFVPASKQAQQGTGEDFVGIEMPLGTTLALFALCSGVKKVAVVTDVNHHDHPASAAFDCFDDYGCQAIGATILCTNCWQAIRIDATTGQIAGDETFLDSPEGIKKYPYPPGQRWGDRQGILVGKNWLNVIHRLDKLSEAR
jgi:CheY-like chemotaxis protein